MLARGLSCAGPVLALLACRPVSPSDDRIASDIHVLCHRAADRSIDTWGQAVMMTDEVQRLTLRVDQGDEAARCELARLMRRHDRKTCKSSIASLSSSCGRGHASSATPVSPRRG